MGKGTNSNGNSRLTHEVVSWEEVQKHNTPEDKWIVIHGCAYDISTWADKHPGGQRIISHFAGQDATEAWTAMHNDKSYVSKFMKPLLIGRVQPEKSKQSEIKKDFRTLRLLAEGNGWFNVNPLFYICQILHILALEVVAYFIIRHCGFSWIPYLIAAILLATAQAQAGWTQHDYGHLSVFNSTRLNHLAHYFVIGFLKGASHDWWTFRHNQHHVKPNVFKKDPDITFPILFLLGEKIAKRWGSKKRSGWINYKNQHVVFWILGPCLLLPFYFHVDNTSHVFKRRKWMELGLTILFFYRFFSLYGPLMGGWTAFWFYMFMRFIESHWFTLVTQMSHLPMDIDTDRDNDWLTSQAIATCNVEPSVFNDWFTGHLNYQLEHHLFPTMPRHNYHKVAPYVKDLCKKHKVPYVVKSLLPAMVDVMRTVKHCGQVWFDAFYE